MKFTELNPNVKWNCPANDNTNVLLICHPQLVPFYLPKLKDFIWDRFDNITIWNMNSETVDDKVILQEIEQMDAVICFITETLLSTLNGIKDLIIPALIETHIPFLPILDGNNLEEIFNQKYGHIHFVSQVQPRKISYEAIEEFLNRILASEERKRKKFEFENLKSKAFSQSFFISYRKIDGMYIDNLQRTIHNDPLLVDTQLWYDSYLNPGQDYDENLKRMIEACNAVILVITPHLLQKDNYVQRIEMPLAKASGKPVIGILMEDTNLEAIHNLYGVENIYKLDGYSSFHEILSDAGIEVPEVNSYPRHLMKLAIAYIKGDNIERNMNVACELLYQATQYNYFPAYEKLIEIKSGDYNLYQQNNTPSGESCVDIAEAERLLEEYTNILKHRYQDNPSRDGLIDLMDALRKYGEFYFDQEDLEKAKNQLLILYSYAAPLGKEEPNKMYTYLSTASLLLAKTYYAMGKYEDAERYFGKSVDTDRTLNDDSTYNAITYTNLLTSLCEFGDFCQKQGKLLKAKIMYEEVMQTIQKNGMFFRNIWSDSFYNGYHNEATAEKTEKAKRFAMISLWEIENERMKMGKFQPEYKVYPRTNITNSDILKECSGEYVRLMAHDIMINSIAKLKWLSEYTSASNLDFDICQNKYCMDAKNFMAMMTLDINDVCQLVVHTADMKQAESVLREITDELNR